MVALIQIMYMYVQRLPQHVSFAYWSNAHHNCYRYFDMFISSSSAYLSTFYVLSIHSSLQQAVLLLREHQSAYDALVSELKRDATLGECILAIETALSKQTVSPVEARRKALVTAPKAVSTFTGVQAAELRKLIETRLGASSQQQSVLNTDSSSAVNAELLTQEQQSVLEAYDALQTKQQQQQPVTAAVTDSDLEQRLQQVEARLKEIYSLQSSRKDGV
jgi:hypothetical protein